MSLLSYLAYAEDLHKGLMVGDDDEVVTSFTHPREISCLLQAPGHGQGLSFDGHIALLLPG